MPRDTKIIHVEFPEPIKGRRHHYFTTIAAIYEKFTHDDIGVTKEYLWCLNIQPGNPFTGKKCTIYNGRLEKGKTVKRGKI